MATSGKTTKHTTSGKGPPERRWKHPDERAGQSPIQARDQGQRREPDERQQREERILDAAATLLVRWGYRKTTVDDVAREAGVGKGTIYLHWRDKNELFRAAIMRANQLLGDDIMRRITDDPQGGLPHRLWAHGMVATLDNPLTAAIMKGQPDIFQGLIGGFDLQTRNQLVGNAEEYVVQLQRAGLIRQDLPVSVVLYLMAALKVGIITAPELTGQERVPPMEELTEAISDLIRRWLEPEQLPSESETGKHLLAELLENVQTLTEHRESQGERE
jgi:AcrR family transcriptional regulator